jgi:hypothetical protein
MKKRKKVTKILENWDVFILFDSYKLRSIKRDTLGKLVSSNYRTPIFKPTFQKNPYLCDPKFLDFRSHF